MNFTRPISPDDQPFPAGLPVAGPDLRSVLSALGLDGPDGPGWLPSAAALFDLFAHAAHPGPLRQLARVFDVVAAPAATPAAEPVAGDLLLRRGDGGCGHLAVVAGPGVWPRDQLPAAGLRPEGSAEGGYVHVVEGGPRPHTLADGFARRVTNTEGLVLPDTLVLRPRFPADGFAEVVPVPFAVGHLPPSRSFVEIPLTYEDFITNATRTGVVIQRTRCDTLADVAAEGRRMSLGTDGTFEYVISHADLITSMAGVPFLWNLTATRRLQAALDLVIYYPADPGDLTRLPAGAARFPLAVVVMGNHDVCTTAPSGAADPATGAIGTSGLPLRVVHAAAFGSEILSHHGYSAVTLGRPPGVTAGPATVPYLQEALATQGIISVSVSTNTANYFDLLLETRADLILKAVAHMRTLNENRASPFFRRIQLDGESNKVAFVGHSRGGDAIIRAALKQPSLKVKALVQLAPTDITGLLRGAAPAGVAGGRVDVATGPTVVTPEVTGFHLLVYGSRDGDVSGFQDVRLSEFGDPFRHYDRSSADRAFLFWHGATHNRFNRFWEDDDEGRVDGVTRLLTTLTSTATTATATVANHHYATSDRVVIAGATPDGYNGEHVITVVNANRFTYSLAAAAASPAAGTITARKTLPAFWVDPAAGGLLDRPDQERRASETVAACLLYVFNRDVTEADRLNGRAATTIAAARPIAAMWKFGRKLKSIDWFDDTRGDRNTLGGRNVPPAGGLVDEVVLANENPPGAGITAFQFMHIDRVLRASLPSTRPPGTASPPGTVSSGRWRAEIPPSHQNFFDFTLLTLRVAKKYDPAALPGGNPVVLRPRVTVHLVDSSGRTHDEPAAGRLSALPPVRRVTLRAGAQGADAHGNLVPPTDTVFDLTKFHLETWEVELSRFTTVERRRIVAVELELTGLGGQPIYVDTISLVQL